MLKPNFYYTYKVLIMSFNINSIHDYRAMLYEVVEEFLFKFGMDGKACLLRAICEMHESPLMGYGLLGEMLELFLT